ncbi:hypothetical protein MNBD_GAMMA18-1213 [hydrothermal vent metagenome]|uniref:Uncharacterized protein n=1 Tax=hydrothermal vent metagenome TaxID=652676 RepID=A0A3B0Z910_9ZZZZ
MTLHCLTTRFTHLPMLLLALFALILQGCGDEVRILPQSDADPAGYYINKGTASVDDGAGGGQSALLIFKQWWMATGS